MLVDHLLNMNKEFKNLKKLETQTIYKLQIILKQSNRKPNKIWVDKESEFYNAYFKKMVNLLLLKDLLER